jgi:hypothetical protein
METLLPHIVGIGLIGGVVLWFVGGIIHLAITETIQGKKLERWHSIHKEMQELTSPSDTSFYSIPDLVLWEIGDRFDFEVEGAIPQNNKQLLFERNSGGYFWKALSPSRIVYSTRRTFAHNAPTCNHDFEEILQHSPSCIQILDLDYERGFKFTKRIIHNETLQTRIQSQKVFSRISNDEFQKILNSSRTIVQQQIDQAHSMDMIAFDHDLEQIDREKKCDEECKKTCNRECQDTEYEFNDEPYQDCIS